LAIGLILLFFKPPVTEKRKWCSLQTSSGMVC